MVGGDGSIWFTDPSYGIDSDHEGVRSPTEVDGRHVYRIDGARSPATVSAVATDFEQPNGLAFSIDERRLFVVDSGRGRNHIRRFDVDRNGGLIDGQVITESSAGQFDGIRIDTDHNIWAAAGDGVHHFDADGKLLGKIHLPEPVSNLAFGGLERNRLFVTATRSLYSVLLRANGVPIAPVPPSPQVNEATGSRQPRSTADLRGPTTTERTRAALTDEMHRMLGVGLGFVATVNEDGTPNRSPKGTLSVWDDDHLAFADIASPQTSASLDRDPAVEINVVDPLIRRATASRERRRSIAMGPPSNVASSTSSDGARSRPGAGPERSC